MRTWVIAALISVASLSALAAEPNWDEILGPPQGTIPTARAALAEAVRVLTFHKNTAESRIKWEADLNAALELAKRENRPVFVTMRCLPCRSCSDFDKGVLEGGGELDPLLLQFVTVRLTSTKDVDMRLLPMEKFQDLDTSWWGWFLSPEGRVYGVFGGRDVSGDSGRTSKAGLIAALKRVLAHHYDPRRAGWDVDGPLPERGGAAKTPETLPGYANWAKAGKNAEHVRRDGCIHCHQVQEVLYQEKLDLKSLDKDRDLDVWPLPENVGLSLEKDDGLLVRQVRGAAAAALGLKPGDRLGAAGGRKLFSQADFRAVLHRAPMSGAATVDLVWLRDGAVMKGKLELADGWRKGVNWWRISLSEGVIGAFPGFWANDAGRHRQARGIPDDAMAVQPYFSKEAATESKAWAAGLRPGDVITAVNGQSPKYVGRQWIVWFRLNNEAGSEVRLTVVDAQGKKRDVVYRP